ncbi:MAG: YceD family protein [Paracoccaceae bacterium]
MTDHLYSRLLRPADLSARKPTRFSLAPTGPALEALARDTGALSLRKVSFTGSLSPQGRSDWRLEAELEATAVQACVVTGAPVTTRVGQSVQRLYLAEWQAPTESETEMPEDDSIEPLPAVIDLGTVLAESLALAMPDYPRAEGAELGSASFAPPGAEPLTEETLRPFASLAELKARMEDRNDESDPDGKG